MLDEGLELGHALECEAQFALFHGVEVFERDVVARRRVAAQGGDLALQAHQHEEVEGGAQVGDLFGLHDAGFHQRLHAVVCAAVQPSGFDREGLDAFGDREDAGLLEIELTERVMMENTEEARRMLQLLKDRGISIAIDDFGTGYSALSHLQLFPLTTLKIDKSFVHNLETTGNGHALLQSIIGIAKSFNLKVVAEGVETEDQRTALGAMACDELQGFLLSRPVPQDKLKEQLLADNRH